MAQNQRHTICPRTVKTQKHQKHTNIHNHRKSLFGEQTADECHVKVANNVEEATKLIEVGFEYVTGDYNDGGKIFRKRK